MGGAVLVATSQGVPVGPHGFGGVVDGLESHVQRLLGRLGNVPENVNVNPLEEGLGADGLRAPKVPGNDDEGLGEVEDGAGGEGESGHGDWGD